MQGSGEKKNEKLKKPGKKKLKKPNREKKSIKILKKLTGSVRFQFYKLKTKKQNRNELKQKKTKPNRQKTEPNRFEQIFVLKNRIEPKPVGLNWFQVNFFKKISVWLIFFDKNRTEPKIITLIIREMDVNGWDFYTVFDASDCLAGQDIIK